MDHCRVWQQLTFAHMTMLVSYTSIVLPHSRARYLVDD